MSIEVHWTCGGCGKSEITKPTESQSVGLLPPGWYHIEIHSEAEGGGRGSQRVGEKFVCRACVGDSVKEAIQELIPGGRHRIHLEPYR